MIELTVKVPAEKAGEYRIEIGTNILSSAWSKIESQFGTVGKFVITDANVAGAGHLDKLLSGRDIPIYVISPGEPSKNMNTLVSIVEAMENAYLVGIRL